MDIVLAVSFDEQRILRLLNWLARENAILHQENPQLPLLYESGVRYQRETHEHFSDVKNLYLQGWEDCDALAAARAGELLARGYQALRQGEAGFERAQRLQPATIRAEVYLRTRIPVGQTGLYHCVVRYKVGSSWYYDDPSARLGMYARRWSALEAHEHLAAAWPPATEGETRGRHDTRRSPP